jgi:aryl-alcohol dehydrogenase-like predicted oxidoreductase
MPKGEIASTTLGKTGIKVSRFGFGSHLKQELIARPKYRDQMIKLGFEGGINLFDVYDHSNYKQFIPMGQSLKGFRKEAIVSLCVVKPTPEVQDEIDGALQSFLTDYIDLYRLYTVDDDRMAILEKNRQAGKIRAIGVVSHDVNVMMKYLDDYGNTFDFIMIVYNFHHNNGFFSDKGYPDNDYSALIPRCERMGLGILGIKPMGSDHMVELAMKDGYYSDAKANPSQAMLRYVFQNPAIDCTMTAMNSMDELFENLKAAYNPKLSSYEETMLKKISDAAAATKGAYLPPHYRWLENWASNRMV